MFFGSERHLEKSDIQGNSIGAENRVRPGVRDIGPPLTVEDGDNRDLKGMVLEKLDGPETLGPVRVTCSAPAISYRSPKPEEIVRVTAASQQRRDCKREDEGFSWLHDAHPKSPNK